MTITLKGFIQIAVQKLIDESIVMKTNTLEQSKVLKLDTPSPQGQSNTISEMPCRIFEAKIIEVHCVVYSMTEYIP